MLLAFLKKGQWFAPALLPLMAIALWMNAFAQPSVALVHAAASEPPLYAMLVGLFNARPLASMALAFLSLLVQVFFINHMVSSTGLPGRYSALPGFIYLVLMSNTGALVSLHPLVFSNLFLLLSLDRVLRIYHDKQEDVSKVFSSAFFVGVAGLFYRPSLVFFLLVILSLLVYSRVSFRAVAASLLGFLAPHFFMGTWLYVAGNFADYVQGFYAMLDIETAFGYRPPGPYEKGLLFVLAAASLFSLARLRLAYMPEKLIRVRRKAQVLFLMFFVSGISFILVSHYAFIHHAILVVPLSLSLSMFFADARRRVLPEILFLLFIAFALFGRIGEGWLW